MSTKLPDAPSPTDCTASQLTVAHLLDLKKSGISETEAIRHGMRSLSDAVEIGALLNWRNPQDASKLGVSLYIPYFDIHGNMTPYCRVKPEIPFTVKDGKPRKYLGPCKAPLGIYFPRIGADKYRDPEIDLIFTEGEKKALCASLFGFPTIGLGGVAGWSIKRERDAEENPIGSRQLRLEIANLPLNKRRVYIAFDSDRAINVDVQREEKVLAKALQALGADVRIVELPADSVGHKQGLDDYLTANGKAGLDNLLESALKPDEANLVHDAVHNPHRLAEGYLSKYMTLSKERTFYWWNSEFIEYRNGAYSFVRPDDIHAELGAHIRQEFINEYASNHTRMKYSRPFSMSILNNSVSALKSLCHLTSTIEPPSWIHVDGGLHSPASLLAMKNGILQFDKLDEVEPK